MDEARKAAELFGYCEISSTVREQLRAKKEKWPLLSALVAFVQSDHGNAPASSDAAPSASVPAVAFSASSAGDFFQKWIDVMKQAEDLLPSLALANLAAFVQKTGVAVALLHAGRKFIRVVSPSRITLDVQFIVLAADNGQSCMLIHQASAKKFDETVRQYWRPAATTVSTVPLFPQGSPRTCESQPAQWGKSGELQRYVKQVQHDYYKQNHMAMAAASCAEEAGRFLKYIAKKIRASSRAAANTGAVDRLWRLFFDLCFHPDTCTKDFEATCGTLRSAAQELGLITDEEKETQKAEQFAKKLTGMLCEPGLLEPGQSTTYVDVGCGDGTKTIQIVKTLCLSRQNALGMEYDNTPEAAAGQAPVKSMGQLRPGINFTYCWYPGSLMNFRLEGNDTCGFESPVAETTKAGRFPWHIKSDSVDLVTCFHVLHHVREEDRVQLLAEISRILRPGGIFLVQEHDCPKKAFGHFLDAVHIFKQRIVYEKELECMPYSDYKTLGTWQSIVCTHGLHVLRADQEADSFTRDWFVIFRKP